jgi:hypothetical protein
MIRGPWRDWLAEPLSRDHLVHAYADEASLVEAVAVYAGVGLGKGDAVVLILTREHAAALRTRLQKDGFATSDLERWGQLRLLDAGEVLEELIVSGLPDDDQLRVIGSVLIGDARLASRSGRVRVGGEMVNLLWERGNEAGALRLERLWNDIALANAIPLFCAYRVEAGAALPDRICEVHTHVVPVEACA